MSTFEVLSTLTTRSGGAAVRLRRESDKLAVEVGSRPNLHRGLLNSGPPLRHATQLLGRDADLAVQDGTDTDDTSVNGTRDAVLHLQVQLGQVVAGVENTGIRNITDSSRLDHIPDDESLHGLVLGGHTAAVRAPDDTGVSTALLVPSVIASLGAHVFIEINLKQYRRVASLLEDLPNEHHTDAG